MRPNQHHFVAKVSKQDHVAFNRNMVMLDCKYYVLTRPNKAGCRQGREGA
jgi:hypothetical protein